MTLTKELNKEMKSILLIIMALALFSCSSNVKIEKGDRSGSFSGIFEYGNFSDKINFQIEQDSNNFMVYFTSLEQNANRIPLQGVEVNKDSINFRLQSDYYAYSFKNKWIENNSRLQGSLTVDTITVPYTLERELINSNQNPHTEVVSFESSGLKLNGTIWYPINGEREAIVILTSSGNADRSASRAEAILFTQLGFTVFTYDKRGTGNSDGDWQSVTIEELMLDDINAIRFFSDKTGIPQANIGIKGSSQGATKIPYVLGELKDLKFGIAVSCPGVSLLESDLNYWKNRNEEVIGFEIDDAVELQRKVFEFIAGTITKSDLERAIDNEKDKSWFKHIWIPGLDEIKTDTKLLYSPIPYFERIKQPILILQGKKDEIIPANSYKLISDALRKNGHQNFKTVVLEGASHSMYLVAESDFPYWSKLHDEYLTNIKEWINTNND